MEAAGQLAASNLGFTGWSSKFRNEVVLESTIEYLR